MAKKRGTQKGRVTPTINLEDAFIYYCMPRHDGRLNSYADVARHFNVSERLIERWGSRRNWVMRREELYKQRVARWQEDKIALAEQINRDLFESWRKMLTLVQHELNKIDEKQMQKETEETYSRNYKEYAEALKNATDKLRILTGQTTDYTKTDLEATVSKKLDSTELRKIDEYLNKLNENRKLQTKNLIPNNTATN